LQRVLGRLAALLAALALAFPVFAQAPAVSQQGRLRILRNGQPLGAEHFEISATPTEIQARAESEFTIDETTVRQTSRMLLGADLVPRRYDWKMEAPRSAWLAMEFKETEGTIRFPGPDGKEDQQVFTFKSPRVALLDNNFFYPYLLLAGLYDFAKGGTQTFEVFIPQSVQPGSVSVELQGVEQQTVAGRPEAVRRLSIVTEDLQVLLWVSQSGSFVRLSVPAATVEVVPEGAGS